MRHGGARAGAGRKPGGSRFKTEAERTAAWKAAHVEVRVYVTPDEHDLMVTMAQRANQWLSSYLRTIIVEHLTDGFAGRR